MQLDRPERERLQKMGTSSLQSRKKRSFSLPLSFRRSSTAGDDQPQEAAATSEKEVPARSAEAAARVQKAAAWQWYTRGVGDAVVPTKRPPAVAGQSPIGLPESGRSEGGEAITHHHHSSTVLQKKPSEAPLAESAARAASRFKAEARFNRPTSAAGAKPTPSAGHPSTPLFDDFDLSGLRTQMADFVQRLHLHQQAKTSEPPAQNSKPLRHTAAAVDGRFLAAAASTDHHHVKPVPSVAASVSSDLDQLSKPPPASAAPVASAIPSFHMRPFSALHRLFRKLVSGRPNKSTKNSPLLTSSPPAIYETEVLPEEEGDQITPFHYHHYIHHHHHHYHYGQSPENSAAIIRSRRRHSESSGIRPNIPSLMEGESDEDEEEIERSSIEAYLARRIRRHSDSFAGAPRKADSDEEKNLKGESAKKALPRQYNSERFSPNKIPTTVSEGRTQPAPADEFDEEFPDISRRRRRHSAESQREGASLERKAGGGGKSGGGTTTYKLSGAAAGGATLVQRRHSEGLQRPEGAHYEMAKVRSPYWNSGPAARYLEDVLERQIGASANAANAPPPRRGLPPVYPQ